MLRKALECGNVADLAKILVLAPTAHLLPPAGVADPLSPVSVEMHTACMYRVLDREAMRDLPIPVRRLFVSRVGMCVADIHQSSLTAPTPGTLVAASGHSFFLTDSY